MRHVDCLSRIFNILVLEASNFEKNLAITQTRDAKIVELRKELEEKDLPFYELRNGNVYRKSKSGVKFYVPEKMRSNVVRTCHDDVGHCGLKKTLELLQTSYWFPYWFPNILVIV